MAKRANDRNKPPAVNNSGNLRLDLAKPPIPKEHWPRVLQEMREAKLVSQDTTASDPLDNLEHIRSKPLQPPARHSDEAEEELGFIRGYYTIPENYWVLLEILDWIAFKGGDTSEDHDNRLADADRELRSACADRSFTLLGTQTENGVSTEVPYTVFSDPIFLDWQGNSIEPDAERATPQFVLAFRPWRGIKALAVDVVKRWPALVTDLKDSPTQATPVVPALKAKKHEPAGIEIFSVMGGRRSGEVRREKAEVWRHQASAHAREIRSKNPAITQDDLANMIFEEWSARLKEPCPVSESTIRQHIRTIERANELPPRQAT